MLNGRLRSVIQRGSGKKELVGEYGRGDLIIPEIIIKKSIFLIAIRTSYQRYMSLKQNLTKLNTCY